MSAPDERLDGPERRKGHKELVKTFDSHAEKIEDDLQRFIKKALIAFAVVGVFCTAGIFGFGLVLYEQSQTSKDVRQLALRANARTDKLLFDILLNKEKVCSQSSNQAVTCQALFERLDNSLSVKQRIRLSCGVIQHLNGPIAAKLRRDNPKCGK